MSMDFIEGLPLSKGKPVIMVVVDRSSKYAHFVSLSHPYLAVTVAHAFLDHIIRLHGLSKSTVSDSDLCLQASFGQSCLNCKEHNFV